MQTCRPWWAAKFIPLDNGPRVHGPPGCGTIVNSEDPNFGWNLCRPEKLAIAAKAKLVQLGFPQLAEALTLDAYSLARNIASESGSGTAEMKLCMALSTMGRAKLRGRTVTQIVLGNRFCPSGTPGSAERCLYGRIHGTTGVDTAPFGRFTASSQDPSVEDCAIAVFALSGGAGAGGDVNNYARGADDQWGPLSARGGDVQGALSAALAKMRAYAKNRNYWVGRIVGVHPLALHLFRRRPEITPGSPEDRRVQAALEEELRANVADLDVVRTPDGFKSLLTCVGDEPGKNGPGVGGAAALGALAALTVAVGTLAALDKDMLTSTVRRLMKF